MSFWVSEPAEELIEPSGNDPWPRKSTVESFDTVIVGTGYGAAMTAFVLALAAKHEKTQKECADPKIVLLERGKEYLPGDFPARADELPGHLSVVRNGCRTGPTDALWDLRIGDRITTLGGVGVGGGSLINANAALIPDASQLRRWPFPQQSAGNEDRTWMDILEPYFDLAVEILGAKEHPSAQKFKKFKALERLAVNLDSRGGCRAVPTPLMVNFSEDNRRYQNQAVCIDCGNCVTGCNTGAKNSLNLAVAPLLKKLGVKIYSGVEVMTIEQANRDACDSTNSEKRWLVNARLTKKDDVFLEFMTNTVVLGAGSLGSTEILQRSQRLHGLAVSDRLGGRFRTNGDTIAFGYGQNERVDSVATRGNYNVTDSTPAAVGPTITGHISFEIKDETLGEGATRLRGTVQDGTPPYAVRYAWSELLCIQALIKQFADSRSSAWHLRNPDHDPLVVCRDLDGHSQTLLAMGADNFSGALVLAEDCEYTSPTWNSMLDYVPFVDGLDAKLKGSTRGFDGGVYLANPLWRAVPSGIRGLSKGRHGVPDQAVTVHPLGGCTMGRDVRDGVVDYCGRVFEPPNQEHPMYGGVAKANKNVRSGQTYSGLYVADGSIIPEALGVNPALTISATGLYIGHQIVGETFVTPERLKECLSKFSNDTRESISLPGSKTRSFDETESGKTESVQPSDISRNDDEVCGVFREYLYARFNESKLPVGFKDSLNRPERFAPETIVEFLGLSEFCKTANHDQENLALILEISVPDIELKKLAENPAAKQAASARMYLTSASLTDGVDENIIAVSTELCEFEGYVVFGYRKLPTKWYEKKDVKRTYRAFQRFAKTRGISLRRLNLRGVFRLLHWRRIAAVAKIGPFFRLLKMHTDWRSIEYEFRLVGGRGLATSGASGTRDESKTVVKLTANKEFAFAPNKQDLWTAVSSLQVMISEYHKPAKTCMLPRMLKRKQKRDKDGNVRVNFAEAFFQVDALGITRGPAPLQIERSPSLPATMGSIMAMGAFFSRVILKTHLLSLRGAAYDAFKSRGQLDQQRFAEPPEKIRYFDKRALLRRFVRHTAHRTAIQIDSNNCARLVCYRPDLKHRRHNAAPVLLVHGLAHSSRVFWNKLQNSKPNFVQSLLADGYDVWLLDHRVSTNLLQEIDAEVHWDDIALEDIPWAVKQIYDLVNIPDTRTDLAVSNNKSSPNGEECTSSAALPVKVNIFAHCIGAGAVSIAILNGALQDRRRGVSMVGAFAVHAVPPWLDASAENRIRANLYSLVKDWQKSGVLNPVPSRDSDVLENIMDRLASVYPRGSLEWDRVRVAKYGPGFAQTLLNRYQFIWGEQWVAGNVDKKVAADFVKMIGPVPISMLRQVFFSVTQRRLTDQEGTNSYLTYENFETNWTFPTLFVHGKENKVFDVESSRRSDRKLRAIHAAGAPSSRLKYPVELALLEGYGHMDVLFGKNAGDDVHPVVSGFFERHAVDVDVSRTVVEQSTGSEIHRPSYKKFSLTGPVISYKENGVVSVWMEIDDFTVRLPSDIKLIDATGAEVFLLSHPSRSSADDGDDPANEDPSVWFVPIRVPVTTHGIAPMSFPLRISVTTCSSAHVFSCVNRSEIGLDGAMNWDLPWYRRASVARQESIHLLLGSCLHPGTSFERVKSDRVFRAVAQQAGITVDDPDTSCHQRNDGTIDQSSNTKDDDIRYQSSENAKLGADALVLLGDFIYADAMASIFDPHSAYERFRMRYREAFRGRYARQVFANLPTHFVIDDHEFVDNWSGMDSKLVGGGVGAGVRSPAKSQGRQIPTPSLEIATREARRFLRRNVRDSIDNNVSGSNNEICNNLWEKFSVAGFPFFSFDTRSERRKTRSRSCYSALVGDVQMKCFEDWLKEEKTKSAPVIFIASGSPFSVITKDIAKFNRLAAFADDLNGYPGFLRHVVNLLSDFVELTSKPRGNEPPRAPRIFWVTGDLHLSLQAEVRIKNEDNGKSVLINHICASGLHAPIPFANADPRSIPWVNDLQSRGGTTDEWAKLRVGGLSISTRARFLTDEPQHFVRLDCFVGDETVQAKISAYDHVGKRWAHFCDSLSRNVDVHKFETAKKNPDCHARMV